MYKCLITSNSNTGREYDADTASALKCARLYGRAEGGEVVTVYRPRSRRIVSRAIWHAESRDYIRAYCAPGETVEG